MKYLKTKVSLPKQPKSIDIINTHIEKK